MTDLVPLSEEDGPVAVREIGPVFDWDESAGSYRDSVVQSFATVEITAIGDEDADGLRRSPYEIARTMLSDAALLPGCDALELRYVAVPQGAGRAHVQMFVTAKSCQPAAGATLAASAATAAAAALPPHFGCRPSPRSWADTQADSAEPIFELRRREEVTFPTWDYIPAEFYYHVAGSPGDGAGWAGFWHRLAGVTDRVTISIVLKQTEVDPRERYVVGALTTDLALLARTRNDYNALGHPVVYPGCENAANALEAWQDRLRLLNRPLLGRVAVRGTYTTAMPVASALASAIAQSSAPGTRSQPMHVESPHEPDHFRAAQESFDWLEIFPWGGSEVWREPTAPMSLRRFPYMYGIDEAAGLAILPVPDDQGVPGFPRARKTARRRSELREADDGGDGVVLGSFLHQDAETGTFRLPLNAINRHVLVVGTPGSGKTTTVLTLLASLWRDHQVPFLVIEPTKTEYRTLLRAAGMADLEVFCLGRDDIAPMRLNPLAPPAGVRMEVHANSVMAALKAALPLPPPLPQLLEESVERAYQRAGWDFDTTSEEGKAPPSLRGVLACFDDVFEEAEYVGEARNVAAALRTRLKSLIRGSRGRVLDTVESMDVEMLVARPVVIELDEIGDPDDKLVMASLILDRLRAVARAKGSSEGKLRHVTVIEEAHRLLAKLRGGDGDPASESSRALGIENFCNAIAELRSVGEGFVLSSQSPARLAAAAVSNCSTRILHHTESADDRDAVLSDMDAGRLEREAAARLRPGEALASWPQADEPELIRVKPPGDIDSGSVVPADTVRGHMAVQTTTVRRLLPYALCTRDVCTGGCDPAVRAKGEAIAGEVARSAAKLWEEHDETVAALEPIVRRLRAESGGNAQTTYCAAAHLSVFGHALNVRRRVDIRPQLRAAIEGGGA